MTAAPTAATGNNCRTCMGTSLRIVLVGLPDGPILSRPIGPYTSRAPTIAQDYSFDCTAAFRLHSSDRSGLLEVTEVERIRRNQESGIVTAGRSGRDMP